MIRFGYFGLFFHGLQPQKDIPTAGGTLRDLITRAAGQPPKALCFAARTDKGVHAIGNVATFWFKEPFDTQSFLKKIQSEQSGLCNIQCLKVAKNIHARGSALSKHYRYVLNSDPETSWEIVPKLNLKAMQKALNYLMGKHDFSSFRASRCSAGSPIKTIYSASLSLPFYNQGICIDLEGDAFLRQMIRILVGVLVEVGTGLRKPEDVLAILDSKNRQTAGITAPAHGLTLVEVKIKM